MKHKIIELPAIRHKDYDEKLKELESYLNQGWEIISSSSRMVSCYGSFNGYMTGEIVYVLWNRVGTIL